MKILLAFLASTITLPSVLPAVKNGQLDSSNEFINKQKIDKIDISDIVLEPIVVELQYSSNDPDEILMYIILKMMEDNTNIKYIDDIGMSILYNQDLWKILGIDLVKPPVGVEQRYNAKFFAQPNNEDFIGILNLDVTLINTKKYDYQDVTLNPRINNVADTNVDKDDRWIGKRSGEFKINVLDYAQSAAEFFDVYKQMTIDINFKHEDEAKHGDGLLASTYEKDTTLVCKEVNDCNIVNNDKENLLKEPKQISVNTGKIQNKSSYTFTEDDLKNKGEWIYNNWGVVPSIDTSLLVNKHLYQYTQNKVYRLVGLDIYFNSQENTIYISLINIAGKWRSGWNQANTHSRVSSTLEKIFVDSSHEIK